MATRIPSSLGWDLPPLEDEVAAAAAAAVAAAAAEEAAAAAAAAADVDDDDDDDAEHPFDFLDNAAPVLQPGNDGPLDAFAAGDGLLDAFAAEDGLLDDDGPAAHIFDAEGFPADELIADGHALDADAFAPDQPHAVIDGPLAEDEAVEYEDRDSPEERGDEYPYLSSFGDDWLLAEDDTEVHAHLSDSDCSYHYLEDDTDRVRDNYVLISTVSKLKHITRYPRKYSGVSHYVVGSFHFKDVPMLLIGIERLRKERFWRSMVNIRRLIQADELNSTLQSLRTKLAHVGKLFQDKQLDLDLITSFTEFLPHFAFDRVNLQPPNVLYYADAISTAIRAMIGAVSASPTAPLWTTRLVDYYELNHCVQYVLRRIGALEEETINYPVDVDLDEDFPDDDKMLHIMAYGTEQDEEEVQEEGDRDDEEFQEEGDGGDDEEVQEEGDGDDEEVYVPYYDLNLLLLTEDAIDPEVAAWVSDSDESFCVSGDNDDNFMGQDILIKGLAHLDYIKSFPRRYSGCTNFILVSYCFCDIPELIHGIRKASEELSWSWVGNMERLSQAYNLRGTLGFVLHELNSLGKLIEDHKMDRVLVASLARFLPCLEFSSSSLQPDFIRYFVDNIAVGLQDLLDVVQLEEDTAVFNGEQPPLVNFAAIDACLQFITERIDALDNQYVQYPQNVERPELLPPLPGPAPLPFPSP